MQNQLNLNSAFCSSQKSRNGLYLHIKTIQKKAKPFPVVILIEQREEMRESVCWLTNAPKALTVFRKKLLSLFFNVAETFKSNLGLTLLTHKAKMLF